MAKRKEIATLKVDAKRWALKIKMEIQKVLVIPREKVRVVAKVSGSPREKM
jgi:hypothetical protein